MNRQEILDVFYNEIIQEARTGRVDCFRMYNIAFSTKINDQVYPFTMEDKYPGIMVPTLCISDKLLFDSLLVDYVLKADEFYDDSNYFEEMRNDSRLRYKAIICALFANATALDYSNPLNFLENRIAMFDNKILPNEDIVLLGHSDILKGSIYVMQNKATINDETPYEIQAKIISDDGVSQFVIPTIRLGIVNGEVYIYAIQTSDMIDKDDVYSKSVYDVLKHIDKGFTLSFIVSAILGISLSNCNVVHVMPFLISRWNSKCILNEYKLERDGNKQELREELDTDLETIQENLSEKFIRIFRRLDKHCEGFNFVDGSYDEDDRCTFTVDRDIRSNRPIVNELFQIGYNYIDSLDNTMRR